MKQAFVNMAMMNYPYESNFIKNLPAWPVQTACSSFKGLTDPNKIYYEEFKKATEIYYGKD
jgi:lysosomal Pro-X carboxypeptidase